jgi:heparanase
LKGGGPVVVAKSILRLLIASLLLVPFSEIQSVQAETKAINLEPSSMTRVGTVDERFQSYNIEAVEVTGGRFWKPYTSAGSPAPNSKPASGAPAGLDPSLFEYRPPIDLGNVRLRKLAAALGPAYVRVSGTWMNSTYFQDSDEPAPPAPPAGFNSVLTREEWKGVIDFAHAVNARIVTSFAISAGTRDADGVWTPRVAQAFMDYTKSLGGEIAAAEFINEPNFAEIGGAPKGYDGKDYARDFAVFQAWAKTNAPHMLILGTGGVGEGSPIAPAFMHQLKSEDILKATGAVFDIFSYHSYGAVSARCGAMGTAASTTSDAALTADWLSRAVSNEAVYAALRDRYLPGKPMWNTETAQAACGGDRWASTFLDTFRYLNQLGSLARSGVQVQIHNTLNASDYGLLDEKTYQPRPDYWAALLWHKLMGTTVLDPGISPAANLQVYAHCLQAKSGGVGVLVINADKEAPQELNLPEGAERYTLTSNVLQGSTIDLNGKMLELGPDDALPALSGVAVHSRAATLAPESITFFAFPKAGNAACR